MSRVVKFIASPIGAIVGGTVGKLISAAALTVVGVLTGNPQLIMAGIGLGASALQKKPRVPPVSRDRLHTSLIPDTPRKIVYGETAMATDVRYQGFTGADQEFYHQIVCVASHEVESIDELWFDSELAWSASGGVQGRYVGYLTVTPRTVGTSANGIAIDSVWTSACTLTGCAYLHLRFKLTGNSKKAESPFSQQIPSRVTVRGKGMRVYDARFDTTAGGSGTQRANDQTTWAYAPSGVESGRNNALGLLNYLIGWKINGKLAVGRGMPADRFDMASFITAANMCDEAVTRVGGSTEPRYRADGIFSEADDPSGVIDNFLASMNAVLRDAGGKISLTVLHNDLGAPVAHFDENDILGDELWRQTPSIDESFNVVRGSYTDPSDQALYQMVDAPEVETPSIDGIERIEPFDVALCQSPSQWQRLAKQRVQRNLYQGVYSASFGARAWQVELGQVVTLSHIGLGWDHKLFRVIGHGISVNGIVPMVLREEHPDIYAWDKEEKPAVQAAVPTVYDPTKAAVIQAIAEHDTSLASLATDIADLDAVVDGKVTTFFQSAVPTSEGAGDLWFKSDTRKWYRAAIAGADAIMAGEWEIAEDAGIGVAIAAAAGAQATADGKVATFYQDATPTAEGVGDLWVRPSDNPKVIKRWDGDSWEAQTPTSLSELDAAAQAAIDAAAASIVAMGSDGILSIADKKKLFPDNLALEARYRALIAAGASKGFPATTENQIKYSEDFTQAAWTKTNITPATNRLTRSSTTLNCYAQQAITGAIGTIKTIELRAKIGAVGGRVGVRLQGTYPTRADLVIDLQSGKVVGSAANGVDIIAATSDFEGDGWYRVRLTAINKDSVWTSVVAGPTDSSRSIGGWEAASTVLSDCFIDQVHVYDGRTQLPYVKTTSAAVTQSGSATADAAVTAREAYYTVLRKAVPAYDTAAVDSRLFPTDSFSSLDPFNPGWGSQAGAVLTQNGDFYTVADNDAAQFSSAGRTAFAVPANAVVTGVVKFKKDAIGRATRYALLRVGISGAPVVNADLAIDTQTGDIDETPGGITVPPYDYGVLDAGDSWLVWVSNVAGASATTAAINVFPAVGTNFGSYSAASTGSISIKEPQLFIGTVAERGGASFRERAQAYHAALEALAGSIRAIAVKIEWSVDGSGGWHSPWAAGDKWMRQSTDNGVTWEAAAKIGADDPVVGFLTNEAWTAPADSAGTVLSYSGATGNFRVFSGLTDVSSLFTLATQANPQALAVSYASQTYTITGGFDAAEDTASLTIRATGSGPFAGITIDKVVSLAKSKTGSTGSAGANAKTLIVLSDRQTIAYDGAGAPVPTSQTTTFSTNKQNTTATVNWSITDINGVARTPVTTYLSAASGNSVTMTEAQFAAARNGTSGVIVTGSLTDGTTITDKISVTRVQAGTSAINVETTGPDSATIACTADGTPKSGALAAAGGTLRLRQAGSIIASGVAFSLPVAATNCGVSINASTGAYTVDSITADNASFTLRAAYQGQHYDKTITMAKAKDGPANDFVMESGATSGTSTTFAQAATVDMIVGPGATVTVRGNWGYLVTAINNTTYTGQCKITYQNVTDSGAETDLATSSNGTPSSYTVTDIGGGELETTHTSGSASTSGEVTNGAGTAKTYRLKIYTRRSVGNGAHNGTATISGSSA